MNGEQLKNWRLMMKYSQKKAASEIGLSISTYQRQEHLTDNSVDKAVELACMALYAKIDTVRWPWY